MASKRWAHLVGFGNRRLPEEALIEGEFDGWVGRDFAEIWMLRVQHVVVFQRYNFGSDRENGRQP